MKSKPEHRRSKDRSVLPHPASIAALVFLLFPLGLFPARANEVWNASPTSGDWNTAANWTPALVPGPGDIVSFDSSVITAISFSDFSSANGIVFNPDASGFTFTASHPFVFTIAVSGITNDSGLTQKFVCLPDENGEAGALAFAAVATAGTQTQFTTVACGAIAGLSGVISFGDQSSAGSGVFFNQGSCAVGVEGGQTLFSSPSTADEGTFTNEPGQVSGAGSGKTAFYGNSHGGSALITSRGATVGGAVGGVTLFDDQSDAEATTLVATGGSNGGGGGLIQFRITATGGTARTQIFGNGQLDVSERGGGMSVGSIEGDGFVFLGSRNLSIGSNGLDTAFSGMIQDGGIGGGVGGSLSKTGAGAFALSGASSYSGGTTVRDGSLIVNNRSGSGTGSGMVQIKTGTLGGSGTMSGAVTVNGGAYLAPAAGTKKQANLTSLSALTFNSGATYTCTFKAKGNNARNDSVTANGITIDSGASFNFSGQAQGQLRPGLILTVLKNTSASPIAGAFSNLADGAILTVNGNNFLASYEGGDGNDLTLTVQ